ncbi:aquaporin AQPAe.a-like [Tachypleus tridentatus]|uniref:aquaporin AQPAe.a-like n=1 Tax=Tachypleus tridentatus TaxID=6853 RepID=UPI003FD3F300
MANVSLESFFLHLVNKVENIRSNFNKKKTMKEEVRTLEFWRSIIAECLATFFYVFLLCGAHISWPNVERTNILVKSFTSGLAIATLVQCFGHISGAHVNPAVTLAMVLTQKITPLRAVLYVTSQCGGAIAGAALLYGVTIPGHQETLGCTLVHDYLGAWQAFGIEFVLTFVIVFTVFATVDPNRRMLGSDAVAIGIAYLTVSLIGLPASGASLNPARSLGPAFVMNKWHQHWVYWFGPLAGGVTAGLIYEYIFDSKKLAKTLKEALEDVDRESNTDDDYDDAERCKIAKEDGGPQASGDFRPQYQDNYRLNPNTYSPTPSSYPVSTDSPYGYSGPRSAPPQSCSSNLYGSRYGNGYRTMPCRMEYGPGSVKF